MISAYAEGNKLYTFIETDENMTDNYEASLIKINDKLSDKRAIVKNLSNTDIQTRYIFLVDCSTSVRRYKKSIENFIESVAKNNKTKAVYSICCFGEGFNEPSEAGLPENEKDAEALIKGFEKNIDFSKQATDPFKAVDSAIDYAEKTMQHNKGEQVNIVLVTDGLLLYRGGPSYNKETSVDHDNLKEKINSAQDIILHTYCLDKWQGEDHDILTANNGLNMTKAEYDPSEAGNALSEYINNLDCAVFDINYLPESNNFDMLIGFKGLKSNSYFQSEAKGKKLSEKPVQKNDMQSAENKTELTSENVTQAEILQNTSSNKNGSANVYEEKSILPYIAAAVVIVIALAIVLLLFVIMKKRSKTTKNVPGAVFIKIDVIRGNLKSKDSGFYLKDRLVIGSSRKCDIIFKNKGVAPENSLLFMNNGYVFIEDMDSPEGTLLGGMKLHSPNRLRSEDEVTIGNVRFRVRF